LFEDASQSVLCRGRLPLWLQPFVISQQRSDPNGLALAPTPAGVPILWVIYRPHLSTILELPRSNPSLYFHRISAFLHHWQTRGSPFTMKTSPRPASVIDTDEKGTPLLQTKRSAARVTKRHSDPGARKSSSTHETKTKPTSKPERTLIVGESRCHGPIHNLVTTYDGNNTLTIFSTGKDHRDETNAVEGACFRKIFLTGVLHPAHKLLLGSRA
jgi:hypothetical protein